MKLLVSAGDKYASSTNLTDISTCLASDRLMETCDLEADALYNQDHLAVILTVKVHLFMMT